MLSKALQATLCYAFPLFSQLAMSTIWVVAGALRREKTFFRAEQHLVRVCRGGDVPGLQGAKLGKQPALLL